MPTESHSLPSLLSLIRQADDDVVYAQRQLTAAQAHRDDLLRRAGAVMREADVKSVYYSDATWTYEGGRLTSQPCPCVFAVERGLKAVRPPVADAATGSDPDTDADAGGESFAVELGLAAFEDAMSHVAGAKATC